MPKHQSEEQKGLKSAWFPKYYAYKILKTIKAYSVFKE